MKFFTKQLYAQMQVYGFLMHFLNEDEDKNSNEDIKEFYQKKGRDYEAEQKQCYEECYKEIKPFLLKYLPKTLRCAVHDEFSIYGKRPNQNSMVEIETYIKNFNDLMVNDSDINIGKEYSSYYKGIEKSLPKDILSLNKQYNFHDSQIVFFEHTNKNQIIIKLNCKDSYLSSDGLAVLTFNNVKLAELSDNYIGNWWLWDETHLSNIGKFDFQALFHNYNSNGEHSLNEFRVVADEVSVSFLDIND